MDQEAEYYMSQTSRKVLETLTQDYIWIRTFQSQSESKVTEKIQTVQKQFEQVEAGKGLSTQQQQQQQQQQQSAQQSSGLLISMNPSGEHNDYDEPFDMNSGMTTTPEMGTSTNTTGVGGGGGDGTTTTTTLLNQQTVEWSKAIHQLSNVANEQMIESILQTTKHHIFSP